MRIPLRTAGLLAALAAVVIVVIADVMHSPPADDGSAQPRTGARAAESDRAGSTPGSATADAPTLVLPNREALSERRAGFFSRHSWEPPPPPPTQAAAARSSPPPAPPMPYRFAGRVLRDGRLTVFLTNGDAVFPIRLGETLDGVYRVDAITETEIRLTYLPLKESQTIPVVTSLATPAPAAAAVAAALPPVPILSTEPATPIPASKVTAAPASSARFAWGGPPQVKLGTRFEVTLRVNAGQPLYAWPLQLRFDPAQFEVITVRPGKLAGGSDPNFSYRVNPDGSILVGASVQNAPAAGDAELLALTLKPLKADPAAEVSVAAANLQGAAGRPIPHETLASFRTAITR